MLSFLERVVSEEVISTDPDKIKTVQDWPRPKTPKQMRGFLGLCSYYRKYVKKFAIIARPLHKLCEKGSIFQLNDECEQAFIRLKDVLTSPGRQHNNADALSRHLVKFAYVIKREIQKRRVNLNALQP